MNAKNNSYRRLVLPINILFMMFWLPLNTYAQGFEEPARLHSLQICEASTGDFPTSNVFDSRVFDVGPGFSETDPANQLFQRTSVVFRSTPGSQSLNGVGFSETDPANEPIEGVENFIQSLSSPMFVNVGFSETDPAANLYKSAGELGQISLRNCPEENAKNMALQIPEFSSLSIKDSHHEFG